MLFLFNFSNDDSDVEISDELTGARKGVFDFLQDAQPNELILMPNCSQKKVDSILQCRPFSSWSNLIKKIRNTKYLDLEILNIAQVI